MSRVRYAKSMRDLERQHGADADSEALQDTMRMIRIVYETDAEVAQAVVPRPLEASVGSEVCVTFSSIAKHVTPDVTIEYRAATLGVRVDYDDKPGDYLLAMPMTSEREVLLARERFGQPAKLADLVIDTGGDVATATVSRRGVIILAAQARRVEELGPRQVTHNSYAFKAFPGCTADKPFDQDPQLVRLKHRYDHSLVWRLEGEIDLGESPFDPVSDLPVRRIIEFEYTEGVAEISGRALRPVPGDWLLPFLHQRYDEPEVEGIDV